MKAKPVRKDDSGTLTPCSPEEATHVWLHMPGPIENRLIPVMIGGTRAGTGNWTWNGSTEAPTLRPSILTKGGGRKYLETGQYTEHVCHSWVTDGKVQFLDDCTHELKGQTHDLLEVDL